MKKLMLAFCLLFAGVAFVNAQDTTQTQSPTQPAMEQSGDQDRQLIQASELPEAVRTSLQSQDFSGWTVSQAYRSTHTDANDETKSMEAYVVELRNGAETKTVKFDKDGNELENEDQKEDQK